MIRFCTVILIGLILCTSLKAQDEELQIDQASIVDDNLLEVEEPPPAIDLSFGFLKSFTGSELFRNLPELAAEWRIPFILLSLLILMISLGRGFQQAGSAEQILMSIFNTGIAIIFIVAIPFVINLSTALVNDVVTFPDSTKYQVGTGEIESEGDWSSPFYTAARMQEITYRLLEVDIDEPEAVQDKLKESAAANTRPKIDDEQKEAPAFIDRIKDGLRGAKDYVADKANALGNTVVLIRRFIVVVLVNFLLIAPLLISSVIIVLGDALRFFLLHAGSVVLPIFIAGATTQVFRNQSTNYMFSMFGIACWPIGWALVNMGAVSLLDAYVNFFNNRITPFMATEPESASGSLVTFGNELATLIYQLKISDLLSIGIFSLLIAGYIIFGTAAAAILIQRMVMTGANFHQAAAASGMQGAGVMLQGLGEMTGLPVSTAGGSMQAGSRYMDDSNPIVQSTGRPVQPQSLITGSSIPSSSQQARSSSTQTENQ